MCALLYCARPDTTVWCLKGHPTWQDGVVGFYPDSDCFIFRIHTTFWEGSPLRLATPTLHRLRRQTNMAADHTTPPLRSLAVFLSRHRSGNVRSINSDDSERVILTSWRCDRSRVLPRMCSCGAWGEYFRQSRAWATGPASAVRVGPKVYTFHLQ
jgi:hypothetical protein